MSFYMVHYRYTDDTDLRDRVRPEHRRYTAALHDQGIIKAGGPTVGGDPGAYLIVMADSEAQVREVLAQDPFALQGAIAEVTVTPWNPVTGVFAGEV